MLGEQWNAAASDVKTVIDVSNALLRCEGLEMKIRGNALGKLLKLRALHQVFELRLANKNELQDLILVDIDVGQHAQLFDGLDAQVLRFVDNQDRTPALRIVIEQKVSILLIEGDIGCVAERLIEGQ